MMKPRPWGTRFSLRFLRSMMFLRLECASRYMTDACIYMCDAYILSSPHGGCHWALRITRGQRVGGRREALERSNGIGCDDPHKTRALSIEPIPFERHARA